MSKNTPVRRTKPVARLLRSRRRHASYLRVLALAALVVAAGTAFVLRVSGITLTRTETVLDCRYDGHGAHTHDSSCYDADGNLVCPLEERPLHVHTPECYATERVLTCGMEESDGHQHTDDCYDEWGELTCEIPEGEGAHQHTDACYQDVLTDRLICGLDEVTEQHVHTDACFRTVTIEEPDPEPEPQPMATEPEPAVDPEPTADIEPEVDQPEPVDVVPADPDPADDPADPVVGQDPAAGQDPAEPAEPTYPKQSFEKRFLDADQNEVLRVEVEAPEGALPEGTTMVADWVDPASVERPVTRVVAAKDATREVWYVQGVRVTFYDRDDNRIQPLAGSKVTFTVTSPWVDTTDDAAVRPYVLRLQDDLHKAITTEEEDAARPAEVLERLSDEQLAAREITLNRNQLAFDAQYFCSDDYAESYLVAYTTERAQEPAADEGEPAADEPADDQGDSEDDGEPAEDQADDVDEGQDSEGEGDNPEVDDPSDPDVEDQPDSEDPEADFDSAYPAQSFKHRFVDRGSNLVLRVEVEAPKGAFPPDTTMMVTMLEPSKVESAVVDAVIESSEGPAPEVASIQAVDITFFDAQGNEVEPLVPVTVTLTPGEGAAPEEAASQLVVHVDDAGAGEVVAQLSEEELAEREIDASGDQLVFDADAFSVYAIAYTVDFHYEVNGESFEYSLAGGSFVRLADLVEALGISCPTAFGETAAPAPEEFVSRVAAAEFSSPGLVWVGRPDWDTTVGALKEAYGLDCEYSAEMTGALAERIDASEVAAGEWVLISLRPFLTEEALTVTMDNGDVFTIRVTDGQIQKTVISASGEAYEVTVTYDDGAEIPEGATLEITEFAEDSAEYQAAREAVVDKKQSEDPTFNDEEFGVAVFDLSIVDEDGWQIEPKAAVDVSMKMKSLPEEAVEENAQHTIEVHHFNESYGDVAVETVASAIDGSVQVEEETAQADFQLESFSTFTISWSGNTNQTYTTARWTYGNGNQSRVYINVYYVDENGNAIQRPANLGGAGGWQQGNNGWIVDHWLGNDPGDHEVTLDIQSVLAKAIPGRTFTRAYINNNGNQIDVTRVIGRRNTNWNNYNSATFFNDEQSNFVYQDENHGNQLQGRDIYLEYSGGPHTTIHYGYMDGDTFVEFEEQPSPTNTSTSFGWAHLIYDFAGTDDKGLHVDWKYSGTYYHTSETTNPVQSSAAIQPLLRYYNNAWRYYNGDISTQTAMRTNNNWKSVADGSDIYVVYEKPVITTGGSPTLKQNAQLPDTPNILKESVENPDGTNTLSLSVTGSRAPMDAEKVADVIVILDLSSSMRRDIGSQTAYDNNYQTNSRSRYYQAKLAVQNLADELYGQNGVDGQQYRMGLITFSNYAGRTYLAPTANQQTFNSTLAGIRAYEGSGTNWEHALQLANQMSVASDRATYIVFVTDGEPSVRQTRGNLTNEQLSGVNWTSNPADEGDIFHGGLSGGQFFPNNNDGSTPDFRDYLGSATFGGLMNNDVWDPRNRNAAVDEVASMVGHNKGFYAIGVSSDVNYLGDFVQAAGVDSDHYKLVRDSNAFAEAIEDILNDLNGLSGQADVRMFDGITDLTQTISKVNQEENRLIGADGNFTYWKSNPPQATWDEVKATWTNEQKDGFNTGVTYAGQTGKPADYATWSDAKKATFELGKQSVATSGQTAKNPADLWGNVWRTWNKSLKDAYNAGVEYIGSDETPDGYSGWSNEEKAAYAIGKKVTFSEWTTRQADGCAAAVYNTETGAVEWNMGEKFMLEDGVTYKVSFICWPSQEAYDIIAKLNNGTITFGDLDVYPQEVWNQFEGNATDGYTLKTNEEHANTRYKSATSVSGNVTVGDEQDPLEFQHVPPMPLDKDKLNVAKTWEASRIDSQKPESVILQVVGGNELYKQFEIVPTQMVDGSTTENYGRSEDIYISCGHIKVDRTTGKVVVYESGHDFTLREVEENSRHWDLDASVCRPMKINTVETMLVLVDNADVPAGMTSDKDYYASGNVEYYRLDGKVYKDTKAWADITGMNTRRSFLDLAKEVLVDDELWTEEVDEKFTYKITINVDPTTLSWDPDIEKYVIISIRGNGYSPAAAIADQTYPTTAKLPSQSGMDSSLIHEHYDDLYLVAESGVEFYLSIKNGWSVRFLNLPVGTTYSIEEVLPANSNYEFDNVRLEVRKDSAATTPISTQSYAVKKVEGTIAETSTLYKVVYQNEAKDQTIQILKTAQDASTPLGGAVFDLYTKRAYEAEPQGAPLKRNLVSSSAEATKGQIDLGSLPAGVYYLVETVAPAGYNTRTVPVVITVTGTGVTYQDGTDLPMSGQGISQIGNASYQLIVTNDAGVSLPEAGGSGTNPFYLFGAMLIGLGSAGFVMLRRKRSVA